jgi:hypothetical protein
VLVRDGDERIRPRQQFLAGAGRPRDPAGSEQCNGQAVRMTLMAPRGRPAPGRLPPRGIADSPSFLIQARCLRYKRALGPTTGLFRGWHNLSSTKKLGRQQAWSPGNMRQSEAPASGSEHGRVSLVPAEFRASGPAGRDCLNCGTSFTRRPGGKFQKFCREDCRREFSKDALAYVEAARAAGLRPTCEQLRFSGFCLRSLGVGPAA